MPLPAAMTPWPPPQVAKVYYTYRQWSAWYSGDRTELATVYGNDGDYSAPGAQGFFEQPQRRGGLVGTLARWFWGTQTTPGARPTKLHVPTASDIAATSSDLLFSQAPKLTIKGDDENAQARLDELVDERAHALLSEAAEIGAALGGVYLRVCWDKTLESKPFLTAVHADAAVPVFKWGRLAEVTFHHVVARENDTVWRHLEHHVPGAITHALFKGEHDNLGVLVELASQPATAMFAGETGGAMVNTIITNAPLLVEWVPNDNTRTWRNDPIAAHLGRADISGVESLLDALDETYTSWMRDIRLGKARLHVPASYLETRGRGKGAEMDLDRELYAGLETLGGDGLQINETQFAIRWQEHQTTAAELLERIISGAGYSAQTFGLTGEVAMTATESFARERKTYYTRGAKIRQWRLALARLAETMLIVDAAQFGTGVTPAGVTVEFPPLMQDSGLQLAQTLQALRAAEAASTETMVRMQHPDWDDEQVAEEVDRIAGDRPEPITVLPPENPPMPEPPTQETP